MFLLNILEAVLAYDLVKIRFMKEKEMILNGNTKDKSRGIQLIGAGLGGSVGCAVRLETRRSRVQPPPRSATFFRGD